ncbi:MAG: hypothetical protein J6N15_01445 [Ruminiclostridium sp.]|nr:hypothetical protein [Ruminiclostridium sp.]
MDFVVETVFLSFLLLCHIWCVDVPQWLQLCVKLGLLFFGKLIFERLPKIRVDFAAVYIEPFIVVVSDVSHFCESADEIACAGRWFKYALNIPKVDAPNHSACEVWWRNVENLSREKAVSCRCRLSLLS